MSPKYQHEAYPGRVSQIISAASAVAIDGQGRLLLVKRGREPQRGRWSLPGGKINPGESFEDAAIREFAEETGLVIEIIRKLGITRMPTLDGREYEIHNFYTRVIRGELAAADDAAGARWFPLNELYDLELTTGLLAYLREVKVIPE
ncbi:NUDIX domain-containing protein [Gulosibacter chungangensis]|uniref:NUDIX domain-containing protein n=1 Tax=Gulosibacter chungangensis TaxID=979746 RepID=A0A7J5BDA1_9MICO|nr:NUDIX domain-containing protein [Gulosibacter chungangensis]